MTPKTFFYVFPIFTIFLDSAKSNPYNILAPPIYPRKRLKLISDCEKLITKYDFNNEISDPISSKTKIE